jgi:hypothetical protein
MYGQMVGEKKTTKHTHTYTTTTTTKNNNNNKQHYDKPL